MEYIFHVSFCLLFLWEDGFGGKLQSRFFCLTYSQKQEKNESKR